MKKDDAIATMTSVSAQCQLLRASETSKEKVWWIIKVLHHEEIWDVVKERQKAERYNLFVCEHEGPDSRIGDAKMTEKKLERERTKEGVGCQAK